MYYLPNIIFIATVIAVLVWVIGVIRDLFRDKRGEATCMRCKKAISKSAQHEYLFLIPVNFGDKYEDEENFLRSYMKPIRDKSQIPAGQRACRVEVYSCPNCNKQQINIKDFLQLSGEEYIKGNYEYAYEPFKHLLDAWEDQDYTS